MIREQLVRFQDVIRGQRIKPRRDSQAVVVSERRAPRRKQALVCRGRQQRLDLRKSGVDQKTIQLAILAGF